MKRILCLLFVSVFLSGLTFGQVINANSSRLYLEKGGVLPIHKIIFKSSKKLFFYADENQICKINLEDLKGDINIKKYEEGDLGFSLIKFSKTAKTGIGLSLFGSVFNIIGLAISDPSATIVISSLGSGLSLVGFFVWTSSYKHLKNAGVMLKAKDFYKYYNELKEKPID